METLAAISRWLAKQHVVTWCVANRGNCGVPMPSISMIRRRSHFIF